MVEVWDTVTHTRPMLLLMDDGSQMMAFGHSIQRIVRMGQEVLERMGETSRVIAVFDGKAMHIIEWDFDD